MSQPVGPGAVPTIEPGEASRRLTAGSDDPVGPLLVDVRELPELVAGRVEGAVVIPMSTFEARFRELPADRPLLVICQSGYRSGLAVGFLAANGYPDAANVAGGMSAWQAAGLPFKRGPLTADEVAPPT